MKIKNYVFKNMALFERALTHSSKSSQNYERMEFLGDSILDFVVGEYLYRHSDLDEGKLTPLRAHFVSENYLAGIFDDLGLEKYMQLGKSLKGKVTRSVKSDMVEALIAGVYLDSTFAACYDFVVDILNLADFENVDDDNFKTQLQELVQANFRCTMKYETTKVAEGQFEAKFFMDEDLIATGYGKDKMQAEQNCAYLAIKKLFKE